jgi:hypothetical protein
MLLLGFDKHSHVGGACGESVNAPFDIVCKLNVLKGSASILAEVALSCSQVPLPLHRTSKLVLPSWTCRSANKMFLSTRCPTFSTNHSRFDYEFAKFSWTNIRFRRASLDTSVCFLELSVPTGIGLCLTDPMAPVRSHRILRVKPCTTEPTPPGFLVRC